MEPLLTSDDVAEILRVDVVTIRRLVNRGELAAYRVGSEFRFGKEDLDNYLQRQRVPAKGEEQKKMPISSILDAISKKLSVSKKITDADLLTQMQLVLTKRAMNVIHLGIEEARRLHHYYLGTEHVLLGLLRESEGLGAKVLRDLGVDLETVRQKVEEIIGQGAPNQKSLSNKMFLITPRATTVMKLATDEARRLGHSFVGTEHLLLGLMKEGEGLAARVLESMGLKLDQVRQEVLSRLQIEEASEPETAVEPVPEEAVSLVAEDARALTCERCGARSPLYFRYCFNCGVGLKSA